MLHYKRSSDIHKIYACVYTQNNFSWIIIYSQFHKVECWLVSSIQQKVHCKMRRMRLEKFFYFIKRIYFKEDKEYNNFAACFLRWSNKSINCLWRKLQWGILKFVNNLFLPVWLYLIAFIHTRVRVYQRAQR